MENKSQNCSVEKLTHEESPRNIFVAGLFWLFLIATCGACLLHMFGLDWIVLKTADIPIPPEFAQKVIHAALKAFELLFAYRILTHKSWFVCFILAVLQSIGTGFAPRVLQGILDLILPWIFALIFRKDRLTALLDWLLLEALMNVYSLLFVLASFGGLSLGYASHFWAAIVSLVGYKLFIVTVYLYAKSKGGIRIWKMQRKLFNLPK